MTRHKTTIKIDNQSHKDKKEPQEEEKQLQRDSKLSKYPQRKWYKGLKDIFLKKKKTHSAVSVVSLFLKNWNK